MSTVPLYWFVLGVLSVWRVTHLLSAEDGPWDLIVRLRRLAGNGFWGDLLDCSSCLSLWVAAPFAVLLGTGWAERLLVWLSFSASAILLERVTAVRGPEPPTYIEEKENHVLWKEESRDSGGSA